MTSKASRREFLKRASALSVAGTAAPLALNLSVLGEASAATASDYKALVCVFLYGGNDHANTLVTYDTASHALYKSMRPATAIDRSLLTPTALSPLTPLPGGRQFALAPALAPLKPLFDTGNMAALLNVGTLIQPLTKATASNKPLLPPKLFSHNDQQSFWQACKAEGAMNGWGGRIGDMLMSGNANATFTCINPSSNAVFVSGNAVAPYRVSTAGAVGINALGSLNGSTACARALQDIITANQPGNLFMQDYAALTRRSIDARAKFSAALAGAPVLKTEFPDTPLADQLQLVARTIASSAALGARRQVFFVSMPGFDTHDGLKTQHPALLATVAEALTAFYQTTVELGVQDRVTTFTGSDFGRSWGNGDGSDHGWGAHHFIIGGAVKGRQIYGTAPVIANNGPDDIGQGRLIPSTGVDQLAATLATWMGVSDSQLDEVLPNLKNFSRRNLGFMKA